MRNNNVVFISNAAVNTRLDRMEANISLVLEHILNEVTALRQETSELKAQLEQQDFTMGDMAAGAAGASSSKYSKNNNTHSSSYYNQNNDDALLFDDNNMDPLDSLSSDMVKYDGTDPSMNISNVANGQVMPLEPFTTMDDFLQFAQDMEDNPAKVQMLVGCLKNHIHSTY